MKFSSARPVFCLYVVLFLYSSLMAAPPTATPVERIHMLPGFKIELLHTVDTKKEGSWVSLAVDPKGRLTTSDQYGALYRITPPPIGDKTAKAKVEKLPVKIGMAQGLLYAFDSLYAVVSYGGANKSGLYRLRDTNGDDHFDEVKLLREIKGGGEHGPHGIVLSPDGKSLYLVAGNHTKLPKPETSRVPRNWQEDQLLPRMPDANGHASTIKAPGGWICQLDPDGKNFELFCSGFRNSYDIAFNPQGELFTYDSDMEWDVGLPWYRPTRIIHAVSGGEYGWRNGSGKFPEFYPDSLPSVLDIGLGSPTGVVFGTGAKFPAKYQRAFFACDWSHGILYAVHMKEKGGSYVATREKFATAAPLPLTDIIINPHDHAMYFTIGGRRTQSGLYRVTYVGKESTAPVKFHKQPGDTIMLRRGAESLHHLVDKKFLKRLTGEQSFLNHKDRHIRFAARIALEHQPVKLWQEYALKEKRPQASMTALLALARNGEKSTQSRAIAALGRLKWDQLSNSQQLGLLRIYGLFFTRMGKPTDEMKQQVLKHINAKYPAKTKELNAELCRLLSYLEATHVTGRTLALLKEAVTQEEEIHLVYCLRTVKEGWTLAQRKEYFSWFVKPSHLGGHSMTGYQKNIRKEAIATLSKEEKLQLKKVLAAKPIRRSTIKVEKRKFVKKWTVKELLLSADAQLKNRNYANGRKMFAAGTCFKCHRFSREGGSVGPDLTAVGGRFNNQNLLESMIEPNKVISDQYESTIFELESGKVVVGRIINLTSQKGDDIYMVLTDMTAPGKLTSIKTKDIDEMRVSKTSLMPAGLLETLSKEEILDLMAYLRSGGNPNHEFFKK